MVQQVEALVTKPDDLSLIPEVPMVERNMTSDQLPFDLHKHTMVCTLLLQWMNECNNVIEKKWEHIEFIL